MSLRRACLFVTFAVLATAVSVVSAEDIRKDVQNDGYSANRSYAISGRFLSKYQPSSSFPDDPTNIEGWINYGIGVGIGFGILFVLGMIFTPTMWIACCCIKSGRCIPEFSDTVHKKFVIAFAIYFLAMLIFGFAAIGTTVATSGNIVGTVDSVKTFSDSVGSFGSDIANDLRDVQGRLTNEVDTVNNTLANFDFGVIFNAIDTLDFVLSNVTSTITYMNDTANSLASRYDSIMSNYTYLQQKERDGVISGVPQNSTVIDAPKDNNAYIQSSKSNLDTYQANVNSARSSVSQASNQYRSSRDAEIQSAKDAINGPITDQINGVQSLTTNLSFSRQNVANTVDPWVSLTNSVRMGVVIGFVLLNLLFIGLWFVGVFKTKPALTEVPYWIAAFTLFWIMLLAAIHIVIFIPTRDVCDRKITYLTSPAVTGMLRNMVPASLTSNTAFSNMFDTVATNPLLILNCRGNETFFSNLNLDLFAFVPQANVTLNDLVTNFEAGTSQIDVSSAANQALAAFDYVRNNLTAIQESVSNYTIRISDAQFLLSNLTGQLNVTNFGAQSESYLLSLVDGVNNYTIPLGETYSLYNFNNLNISAPPYDTMDSNNRTRLNDTLNALTTANQTYTDALIQIADISAVIQSMNTTFNFAKVEVLDLVKAIGWIQGNASLAETTLASMTSLQRNFIDTAIAGIKQAVANTRDILKLGTVGKCSFIGDFYNNGIEGGMCNGLSKSVGGAGVTLAIFGILMFASTWMILWTKPALFVGGIKGIKDDDL